MKKLIRLFAIVTLILPLVATAGDLVKKPSNHDVQTTLDRLENIVKEKGMQIFARIDHKKNAKMAKMNMGDAQVLIFGNPGAGTRIMLNDPAAGLDLPLRVLAYKDYDGKVWIVYHDPEGLKQNYGLEQCVILPKVSAALGKMPDAAGN